MNVRRGRRCHQDDTGSAVVEFVALGILLLIPLVHLVVTLGRVQAAAFAADSSARAAARALASAEDERSGRARALTAVRLGLRDHGFDDDPVAASRVTCSAAPCLVPEGRISVQVDVRVAVFRLPGFVTGPERASITVRSECLTTVDRFRSPPSPKPSPDDRRSASRRPGDEEGAS